MVEVTVVINAATPVPSLKLAKSSGHPLLDEQAMEMLGRAIARVPLAGRSAREKPAGGHADSLQSG